MLGRDYFHAGGSGRAVCVAVWLLPAKACVEGKRKIKVESFFTTDSLPEEKSAGRGSLLPSGEDFTARLALCSNETDDHGFVPVPIPFSSPFPDITEMNT